MIEETLVKIICGAKARLSKEGIVTGLFGSGQNSGKVQVEIDGKKYWYAPEDLEIVRSPSKTDLGNRIRITNIPGGITNLEVGLEGVVIAEPYQVGDFVQVKIQLDDGREIVWKESDLEVIKQPFGDLLTQTKLDRPTIKIDPELKSLITPLTDEERKGLEADLLEHGCLAPLVVWFEENILLDGHNRYALCSFHQIEYKIVYLSFANKEDAKEWMIKQQLGRRNLTRESIAYYRGQLYNTMKNKVSNRSGENQYTIGEKAEVKDQNDLQAGIKHHLQSEQKDSVTANVLSKEYRVGSGTIKRDGDYAKAIDILNGTVEDPEFIGSILTKKFRLSRIDAGKLAIIAEEHSDIVKDSYNRGKSGKEWRNKVESKIKKIN
ncbi:MAG: hypothetical protein ACFBSE_00700, partial [Prochloraceae cyanobacterium]